MVASHIVLLYILFVKQGLSLKNAKICSHFDIYVIRDAELREDLNNILYYKYKPKKLDLMFKITDREVKCE